VVAPPALTPFGGPHKLTAADHPKGEGMAIRRHIWAAAAAAALASPGAAWAAVDFSAYYAPNFHEDQPERIPGPDVGDYAGLPINQAARMHGDAWNASIATMPERQCFPHPAPYELRSVNFLHMWETRDNATQALTKIELEQGAWVSHRDIWMDGRAHPPAWALPTHQGFSTGRWEGDALVVKTTHLKYSFIRRNGLPMSDKAEMTERFIRHGNVLHYVMMLVDPVYLTEPLVKTTVYTVAERPNPRAYPCRPAVEIPRPAGEVPHNGMGDHAAAVEYAARYDLPLEGVRGGAETALPEFMDTIAER